MSNIPTFDGFPEQGLQFLRDIEVNNNKAWFQANKAIYDEKLLAPAQSFVTSLGLRLQEIDPSLEYDTRSDGRGVLMRFYRDTRFSKDKSPYKTNLAGMFTGGAGKKTERPAFGFHMGPDSMELMTGIFKFSKDQLAAYREAVAAEKTGSELTQTLHNLGQQGNYHIVGEHYKRVPSGYDDGHPRANLLRYAGLYVHPDPLAGSYLSDAGLVNACFARFQEMAPLYHWLSKNI